MCSGNCGSTECGCEAIKLPRGPRGLQGPIGPTGLTGPAGAAGTNGTNGTNGVNAWTLTVGTAPVIGADGSWMTINVLDTTWMGLGQMIHLTSATGTALGYFQVFGIISTTQVTVLNPRDAGTGEYINNANGSAVTIGSKVSPAGIQGPIGLSGAAGAAGPAGPVGPAGTNGTNGYSPVTTTGVGVPAGGTNGDIYFRQVNAGQIQVYTRPAGVWTAGITITSNRFVGFSASDPLPNPSGTPVNAGDTYATQISGTAILYRWNGFSWDMVWTLTSGGGGGVGTFQQVSDASPVLGPGRNLGTNVVTSPKSIQYQAKSVNITSLLTTTVDTTCAYHKFSIQVVSFALDYATPTADYNRVWIIQLTNDFGAVSTITWAPSRWSKNPGLTQPTVLLPGEVVSVHCNFHNGKMNMTVVEQGVTVIL